MGELTRRSTRPPETPSAQPPRGEGGFTLLEVLVALVVLGVAIGLGLGLLAQQHRVLTRLAADQQADRAVEQVLEELRSGAVPLTEGLSVVPTATPSTAGKSGAEDLRVVVRVQRREPPANLFETSVEVRYRVLGRDRVRRVETLFWKPGKAKLTP